MDPEEIKKIIEAGLPCDFVQVHGDGQHFEAVIVSEQFAGKSRVQRQQLINAVLRADFDSGKLHALSMKTLTVEEAKALRG